MGALDALLARILGPSNAEQVAEAIAAAVSTDDAGNARAEAARRCLVDAEARIARYRAALDSGADPTVVS